MSEKSKIEWTEASWNPTVGCTRVSRGCDNCYAVKHTRRLAGKLPIYQGLVNPGKSHFNGTVRTIPERLEQPLRWRKPRRIFVNSMSDLFHEGVPFDFIDQVFAVMAITSWHTYQILTKRPERMAAYSRSRNAAFENLNSWEHPVQEAIERVINERPTPEDAGLWSWPLPNVWLGTSVEDQAAADERIPHLLQTPAAVRFLSCEPLLGPLDLDTDTWLYEGPHFEPGRPGGIDWVIAGGESGFGARPMHPDWARSLRDQCLGSDTRFFFKQWGAWGSTEPVAGGDLGGDMRRDKVRIVKPVGENDGHFRQGDVLMRRVGKKVAGRELDGRTWDEFPRLVEVS